MADMRQTGQQAAHGVNPIGALPDVADLSAVPHLVAQPSVGQPDVTRSTVIPTDVTRSTVTLAGVAQAADATPITGPSMPAASDTSPPQASPQSPPPRSGGDPPEIEQLALPPPSDETLRYAEPVKEVIADIFDFCVPGDPPRNNP
jgi:hypothetical protein